MADPLWKTTIRTKVPKISEGGTKTLKDFRTYMKNAHEQASKEAINILLDEIVKSDSVSSGKLFSSVTKRIVAEKDGTGYTSEIGFKKPGSDYAFNVNYGRRPGQMPPIRAIKSWLRTNGLDVKGAFGLARHIATEGVEPKFFMEKADKRIRPMFNKRIKEAIKKYKGNIK